MISEKKFELEIKKRNDIINQLRVDRNKMIINYQKINSDLIEIFNKIQSISNKLNNDEFNKEMLKIKEEFKNYF